MLSIVYQVVDALWKLGEQERSIWVRFFRKFWISMYLVKYTYCILECLCENHLGDGAHSEKIQ